MRSILFGLVVIAGGCTFQAGTSFPGRGSPPPAVSPAPAPAAAAPASLAAGTAPDPAAGTAPAPPPSAPAPAPGATGASAAAGSPPPWNDQPATYDPKRGPTRPGGTLHDRTWDCGAHDQCLHPASLILCERAIDCVVVFAAGGKYFAFAPGYELERGTAHRTRRARDGEVVVGARVFGWEAWPDSRGPTSWAAATKGPWAYGVVAAIDEAEGVFSLENDINRRVYALGQARVSIEQVPLR